MPVVFGTEYCKEEGGLLLYCLVLVGEVNYHYRGILQFQQNHQAYFQGHLMLYQDMFDNFLAKDPQKWENHKIIGIWIAHFKEFCLAMLSTMSPLP